MNRKSFLGAILPLGLPLPALPAIAAKLSHDDDAEAKIPPYLKAGDLIGIMSPAGYISREEIAPALAKLEEWGYRVRVGETIGKKDFSFAGTDSERLRDLQQMLDDREIKAILFGRGGYGMVRIIDQVDFTKFKARPKWIIGFSDITVLHSHINRHCGIASIHGKMCNSFPGDWSTAEPVQKETIESIRLCLTGSKMSYTAPVSPYQRNGKARGILVGGNLKTLESLAGSNSDLSTQQKILFVEDTGEYLYSIDRMFWNLKRTGKLDGLKGLVIGGFKVKPDDPGEEFGRTVADIVLEKTRNSHFPICFDFPVGHQKNNYALKCGKLHHLDVQSTGVSLREG